MKNFILFSTCIEFNKGKIKLPDLRGQFIRGVDYDKKVDIESDKRINEKGVVIGGVIGSFQGDAVGPHTHKYIRMKRIQRHCGKTDSIPEFDTEDWDETRPSDGIESRPKNVYVNYIIRVK